MPNAGIQTEVYVILAYFYLVSIFYLCGFLVDNHAFIGRCSGVYLLENHAFIGF